MELTGQGDGAAREQRLGRIVGSQAGPLAPWPCSGYGKNLRQNEPLEP
jgi:hypothetical protein